MLSFFFYCFGRVNHSFSCYSPFLTGAHARRSPSPPPTGHLVSSILVHMLCNFMGVPDITFSIAPGNHRESTRTSVLHDHRIGEKEARGAGSLGVDEFWCLVFSSAES